MNSDMPGSEEFVRELTAAQASLYAYVLSLLPDREAARDVLQETNVVLWQKAEEFTPGSNFIAWSYSIARHKVLAHHRDAGRDRHVFDDALIEKLADDADHGAQSTDDVQLLLDQCLDELSASHRELIRARYEPGGTVKQLAAARRQSPQGLSVTLNRIRHALLQCVQRRLRGREAK